MMIPGFFTIKCHMYDRKKIRSAQNVTDVSFFVVSSVLCVKMFVFRLATRVEAHLFLDVPPSFIVLFP